MSQLNQPAHPTFYQPDPVADRFIHHWLFADLLPWQQAAWDYMTGKFPRLPHALLFAGNAGTGKRAFVYRFVAWALCQHKTQNTHDVATACGTCESCQWLLANTHPNLYQLPAPVIQHETAKTTKSSNKTSSAPAKLQDEAPTHQVAATIKIDDIRSLQPFVQQSSEGLRLVVIHQAEAMTLGASNALLKTLEEPADNVLMLLISDTPSQLLPTIRSRLQSVEVSRVSPEQSLNFMTHQLPQADVLDLKQVSHLSGCAPFVAMDMLHSHWYQHRQTWLSSWQAIRAYSRTPLQASDYWQKNLTLSDFLYLSQLMLTEVGEQISGLGGGQADININVLTPMPSLLAIYELQQMIEQIWQDRRQHIQDKLCYDKLLFAMQAH